MNYNEAKLIVSALKTYLIELNKEKDMVGYYYQYTGDQYNQLLNNINSAKRLIEHYRDNYFID